MIAPSSIPPLGGSLGCVYLFLLIVKLGWPKARCVGRITSPPTPAAVFPTASQSFLTLLQSSLASNCSVLSDHWFPRDALFNRLLLIPAWHFCSTHIQQCLSTSCRVISWEPSFIDVSPHYSQNISGWWGSHQGPLSPLLPAAGFRWIRFHYTVARFYQLLSLLCSQSQKLAFSASSERSLRTLLALAAVKPEFFSSDCECSWFLKPHKYTKFINPFQSRTWKRNYYRSQSIVSIKTFRFEHFGDVCDCSKGKLYFLGGLAYCLQCLCKTRT